jgi:hypothetical protein
MLLAGSLALLTLAAHAAPTWPEHSPDPARLARGLDGLAPGDTLAWVTHTGEEGRGVLLGRAEGAILCEDGIAVADSTVEVLWQRRWTRGNGFARGLGGGLVVGVVAGVTAGNVYRIDSGGLQNLGAGLATVGLFVLGLVGGTLVGAVMPPAPSWDVVYTEQYDPRPPGLGVPAVRQLQGAYAELGAELGHVGWGVRDDGSVRGSLGLWIPVADNIDAGVTASAGAIPGFDGADRWDDVGPASVLAELRTDFGNHGIRPYLGGGVGYLGELGDSPGWTLCLGLESMRSGQVAWRLEGGTRGAWERVGGDRAGLAYLALRLDVGLADQGPAPQPTPTSRRNVR